MPPRSFRLPHSGLTVPHLGYAVTAYHEFTTHHGVAFTATLRLHRSIIGTVENAGVGGPDLFHPSHQGDYREQMSALQEFAADCLDARGTTPELEFVLGDLVTEYQTGRDIARAATRGNTLLRMMQDGDDDNGPLHWPVEAAVTEAEPPLAIDHAELRSRLLSSRRLAPSRLAWWQIWDADAGRWTDLTDRPAHLSAGRCEQTADR